ncbi:hypothetical protein P9379_20680 [Bacillus subtilis]|nr:hypothetical protein [Bacillus subtilis]
MAIFVAIVGRISPWCSGCGLPEDPGFLPPAQLKPGHIIYGHYPPVLALLALVLRAESSFKSKKKAE